MEFEEIMGNNVQNNQTKIAMIGTHAISESDIRKYGSSTGNLKDSQYAKEHNGVYVLHGTSKFTPSRANTNPKKMVNFTLDDGTKWTIGLSQDVKIQTIAAKLPDGE